MFLRGNLLLFDVGRRDKVMDDFLKDFGKVVEGRSRDFIVWTDTVPGYGGGRHQSVTTNRRTVLVYVSGSSGCYGGILLVHF